MGTVVDTTVFIDLEREAEQHGHLEPIEWMLHRLARALGDDEETAIAAITASELLHGLHRAQPARRARREAFVEGVIGAVPVLEFGLPAARAYARLWVDLVAAGTAIGAHDRIVAATAASLGWRVATSNVRDFSRVPGIDVLAIP